MGNIGSAARQVAQSLPTTTRKLQPFTPAEIAALNKMAEQDQARMKELPSVEDMNIKNTSLDQLLGKIGGSISGRDLSPDEPEVASTSGRFHGMPPARPPQTLVRARSRRAAPNPDDQPGRLQSYVIKEVLEARTEHAAQRKELDLQPYVAMHRADAAKLAKLMEHACLPLVGKVATFGHQYAYARAPLWWLKVSSGAQFLSEPDEERLKLWGNPVEPGSLPGPQAQLRTPVGQGGAAPLPADAGQQGPAGGGSGGGSGGGGGGSGDGGGGGDGRVSLPAEGRRAAQ